ncbi:MAG: hypothetical protein SOX77_04530 [Candidatus Borkfalkiaceae bacterium]|nr:hypothetical protein [Christensenellaceae bacterium]
MLKTFVIAIAGLSVVYAVAGTIMPGGKTKKILSFCLSCAMVLAVSGTVNRAVSSIKNVAYVGAAKTGAEESGDGDSDFGVGKFGEFSCDNERLRIYVANAYILRAKNALKKQGISLKNAAVSFGENNDKVMPEKFIINSQDLVIIGENEHINIPLKCKELLEKLFYGENVKVIIDE